MRSGDDVLQVRRPFGRVEVTTQSYQDTKPQNLIKPFVSFYKLSSPSHWKAKTKLEIEQVGKGASGRTQTKPN
jgi:hypothetical protein